MVYDIYQHNYPMSSVIVSIFQMRRLRLRELRNLPMVMSLKVACQDLNPGSPILVLFTHSVSLPSGGRVLERRLSSEVRKLEWVLSLPFVSWPFRKGDTQLLCLS